MRPGSLRQVQNLHADMLEVQVTGPPPGLPLWRSELARLVQSDTIMALPRYRGTPKTVLLVDDYADVLTLVRTILEDAGFEVLPASSAKQAICIEAQFLRTIHLLISDVMMPDMCGPDLASALKKRRPEMQVMLMSGHANGPMPVLNHRWHFIRKPFLPTALLAGVTDVLSTTVDPAEDR